MPYPYLEFEPLRRSFAEAREYDLLRNKLAMEQEQLGFERARQAHLREMEPLQVRQLKTGVLGAEEALEERRKLRADPLFSDGSAASSSTAKAPIAPGGSSAAAPASGFPPSMLQTFAKAVRNHVLDQPDQRMAQQEFRTLLAHPEFGQHLQQNGYVLNSQDWRGDAQRIVQDIERAAGGPMGPTVAQGQGQQAAAASPQADYADARAAIASGAPIPPNRLWVMQQKAERLFRTGDDKLMEAGKALMSLVETGIKGGVQLGPQGVEQIPGHRDASGKTGESEHQMRGDLRAHADVQAFEQVKQGYGRILDGASAKTGAGDIAIIYGYMKTLDPMTGIREGEAATARNTGPAIPGWVINLYNKALTGEMLPPSVRADIVARGKQLYDRAEGEYNKIAEQYKNIARRAGNNPENVVIDRRMANPPVDKNAPQAPAYNPGRPTQTGSVQIPSNAVRALLANPALAADFDAKYGAGKAQEFLTRR